MERAQGLGGRPHGFPQLGDRTVLFVPVREGRRPRAAHPGSDRDLNGPRARGSTYFRTFTARVMTSATVINEIADWTSIVSLAHRDIGMTSVGLNAVAFVNDM